MFQTSQYLSTADLIFHKLEGAENNSVQLQHTSPFERGTAPPFIWPTADADGQRRKKTPNLMRCSDVSFWFLLQLVAHLPLRT
ncbi:hypothetical protein MUK42_31098 [Musa troglodytarum]|uniref:Uncharacterized protein n=1 Tax=Musa troglodytarum TaxID=320322 RepID=A0A9E7GAW2_9LILI|nr:hypothetical protein MUK42_31098 [Musa troglodytarum]